MAVSIQVENVTKHFTLQYHRTLKQMAVASIRRLPLSEEFIAVNDVFQYHSFTDKLFDVNFRALVKKRKELGPTMSRRLT